MDNKKLALLATLALLAGAEQVDGTNVDPVDAQITEVKIDAQFTCGQCNHHDKKAW